MSYALELTEPAKQDWQRLEIWLQEEVLDELDVLAASPPMRRRRVGDTVYDFVRQKDASIYYVFITVRIFHHSHLIRVKSIGQHIKPIAPHP